MLVAGRVRGDSGRSLDRLLPAARLRQAEHPAACGLLGGAVIASERVLVQAERRPSRGVRLSPGVAVRARASGQVRLRRDQWFAVTVVSASSNVVL